MLVGGEREPHDLEPVGGAEQAVEIDAEGVRGQFRVESRAQPLEHVGVVMSEAELLRQLVVDRLDDLPRRIDASGNRRR